MTCDWQQTGDQKVKLPIICVPTQTLSPGPNTTFFLMLSKPAVASGLWHSCCDQLGRLQEGTWGGGLTDRNLCVHVSRRKGSKQGQLWGWGKWPCCEKWKGRSGTAVGTVTSLQHWPLCHLTLQPSILTVPYSSWTFFIPVFLLHTLQLYSKGLKGIAHAHKICPVAGSTLM